MNSEHESQSVKTHRQEEPDSKHFNTRDKYFSRISLGQKDPVKAEIPVPESSSQAASDEETVDEASVPEVTDRPILLNEALLTFLALPAIILFLTFKAVRKYKSAIWYVGLLLAMIFGLTGFFAI